MGASWDWSYLRVPAPISHSFMSMVTTGLSQVPVMYTFGFSIFPLWIYARIWTLLQNFGVNRFQSTVRFSPILIYCVTSSVWKTVRELFQNGKRQRKKPVLSTMVCNIASAVIQFSCQTLGDCLCTPDALHNSNSIRYFWASVCVCVIFCTVSNYPTLLVPNFDQFQNTLQCKWVI